jgi:hypothetical protein
MGVSNLVEIISKRDSVERLVLDRKASLINPVLILRGKNVLLLHTFNATTPFVLQLYPFFLWFLFSEREESHRE